MKMLTPNQLSMWPLQFKPSIIRYICLVALVLSPLCSIAQVIRVNYEFLAAPSNNCTNDFLPGDRGTLDVGVGTQERLNVGLNVACEYTSAPVPNAAVFSYYADSGNCDLLTWGDLSLSGTVYNSNGTLYVDIDGHAPFVSGFTAWQYSGSIKVVGCGSSLPPNSSVALEYVPPGSNVVGAISFSTPIAWSITKDPGGAKIVSTGPMTATLSSSTNL